MLMGEFILSTIKIEPPSGRILEHRGKNKLYDVQLFIHLEKLSDFAYSWQFFYTE